MRVQASSTVVSWIPSDITTGAIKAGFDVGLTHYDDPPPQQVTPPVARELSAADRFRFANVISAWADVDGGAVHGSGYQEDSDLVIGVTRLKIGPFGVTFRAGRLPTIRHDPEPTSDGGVRLVQTAGGRTGAPFPRPVPRAPFAQWLSPVVWTTVALTLRPDGSSSAELVGASGFPRHWLYDDSGALVGRSGVTDQSTWIKHSFGERTPWGEQDSPVVVAEAGSSLEHDLSADIMRGGHPSLRRLREGEVLTRQGEPGDELYLVLDGMLDVDVDGTVLARIGPGAVLGERAILEAGLRTSTLTAATKVVVAVAPRSAIDLDRLAELSAGHHREDA